MSELEYDEATHVYRYGGTVLPHVTEVLAQLQDTQWFTEQSRWRGSCVHRACQYLDEGDLDSSSVAEEFSGYVDAWAEFRAASGFTPQLIEHSVMHPRWRYAGTLDREGSFPDATAAIVDIKTGPPAKVAPLQLAAYVHALGSPSRRRIAVRLRPDGTYSITEYPLAELSLHWNQFLVALNFFNLKKDF